MSNNYCWYPGHMTKAMRSMKEDISLVSLVIEILDARIPLSSRNPDIDALARDKSRILLLNKADLADEDINRQWEEYFSGMGITVLRSDARKRGDLRGVDGAVKKACAAKLERDKKRGIIGRPVRAMVAGIPNVGKSTFINSYAGRACAKTGNRPGVTKGRQWIKLSKTLELLDTPGVLWPRFEDNETGMKLAFIGSMNDGIFDNTELAMDLLDTLSPLYPGAVKERYGDDIYDASCGSDDERVRLLYGIAAARGALTRGGDADLDKAGAILVDDFRSGRLGRISLERPPSGDL